jgi:hypothetical protein
MRAVGHDDHETVDVAAVTSTEDLHLFAVQRVVMVVDGPHLWNVSSL